MSNDVIITLALITVLFSGYAGYEVINTNEKMSIDSNEIQDIINNSENVISLPGKLYNITKGLELKSGNYEGVADKTIFYVGDDFVKGSSKPSDEFAIYNKNFSVNYDNPDEISMKNITFILENKNNTSTIKTLLGFANIKWLYLENCKIIIKNNFKLEQCGFDLYAAIKNVMMKNCYIQIDTFADSGGNWVRNCSEDYSGNSISENIILDNCIFKTNSKDEALAVYGWNNKIRNVSVLNCNFIQEGNNSMSMLISIFGSDRPPYENKNGAIENVILDRNKFEVSNSNAFVIQIGNDGLIGEVDNVAVSNSEVKVHCDLVAAVRGYSYCKNVTIENTKFDFDDHKKIQIGIYNVDNAINNVFNGGKLNSCMDSVKNVIGNACKNVNADVFANDCQTITNNNVSCSALCNLFYSNNVTIIKENVFNSSSKNNDAIKVNYDSQQGNKYVFVSIENNSINLLSTKNKLAWSNDTGAFFGLKNNTISNANKGVIVYPNNAIVYDNNNSKNGKVEKINS